MNSRILSLAAAAALCLTALPAHAERINLLTQKGSMELGGQVSITIESVIPEEGDSVSGQTLTLAPQFGWFVADNFELLAQILYSNGFGDLHEKSADTFGFLVGAEYFIQLAGPIRPYIGALLGISMSIPDEGDSVKNFDLAFPLGILFPLFNKHVALDVGLRVNVHMPVGKPEKRATEIDVPIGYLGVRAFWGM